MTIPTLKDDAQNRRRTLEQERGARAWDYVLDAKRHFGKKEQERPAGAGQPEKGAGKDEGRYRALALGLNAMIQINGLGQSLAFFKAKSNKKKDGPTPDKLLYDQLSEWIGETLNLEKQTDLLEWILKTAHRDQYRQATAECMAFGLWLRRFAEAELEGSSEQQSLRGDEK